MARVQMTAVSFGDEGKPLGLVLLEGHHDAPTAARLAHFMNLNPGGSVMVQYMPDDVSEDEYQRVRSNRNRLLTAEEAARVFGASIETVARLDLNLVAGK